MCKLKTAFACIIAFAFFVCLGTSVHAQSNITLDWGGSTSTTTSTGLSPYAALWSQARHQYVITREDIVAAGINPTGPIGFTALSFYIASIPSGAGCQNFTIKMKNTSATNVTSFDNSGLLQVYGPVTMTPSMVTTTGWFKHNFSTPFMWDGVSNVLVDVCHDNGNNNYTSTWSVRYGNPTAPASTTNRYCYYYSDTMTGSMCTTGSSYTASPYTNIPCMQIDACSQNATTVTFSLEPQAIVPGNIPIPWSIYHPSISFNASLYFQLYTPTGTPVGTLQGIASIPVTAGVTTSGTFSYDATGIAPGFYRIESRFTVYNSCNLPQEFKYSKSILLLSPGMVMCNVWPGDVNNDGVVNYGDRKELNKYIVDANLRSSWIEGYARYKADFASNPMTYTVWEEQAGLPWNTENGCYMDADGNGVVNNFDYLVIKLNWMRTHTAAKLNQQISDLSFDMTQNFPNPFNPSTRIAFSVPEKSEVRLIVVDMQGRTVATLVEGTVETGRHEVTFDASSLSSGQYMATVTMSGNESGLSFSKTIKMSLSK
jgi:hypothetical protein